MFQQFFAGRDLLELPVFAMVLFILTFAAVVTVVWRRGGNDPTLEAIAKLPLEDENA